MTTDKQELQRLCDAATPGPWETKPEECDKPYIRIRSTVLGGRYKIANVITPVYDGAHEREAKETRANAAFIAAARTAIPELLAELAAVTAERDALKAQVPEGIAEKYNELLYHVARKFPNESRHETALRYIKNAESVESYCAAAKDES